MPDTLDNERIPNQRMLTQKNKGKKLDIKGEKKNHTRWDSNPQSPD